MAEQVTKIAATRETILIERDTASFLICEGVWEDEVAPEDSEYPFTLMEEEETYCDLGKGFEDIDYIARRNSDGKFFKFSARQTSDDTYYQVSDYDYDNDATEVPATEVFAEPQTIITYV